MTNLNETCRGLIIAGTHSSVGKSSIAMGLMRCFKNRGYPVKPFKVGPDYIDPGHHTRAAGHPSYNLDCWMGGRASMQTLFNATIQPGDRFVIEGVMGMFDGAYATKETGSTAEIAHLLDAPVVLVIDGSMLARSAAAIVKGFVEFDDRVNVLGVIANRVNSPGHAQILKEAIEHHTPTRFLGHLPCREELKMPSRHLGLHLAQEQGADIYDQWAAHLETHLDIPSLLELLPARPGGTTPPPPRWPQPESSIPFSVAIAQDESLHFIYQDTLDLIQHYGGRIQYFSPLRDNALPDGVDWVYLPGGYPELYAGRLSGNIRLLQAIRKFANAGGTVVGECGGLMLLGKTLTDAEGVPHRMAGVFNFSTTLSKKKLTIGYRELNYHPPGQSNTALTLRGHEFHCSSFEENGETPLMSHHNPETDQTHHDGYRFKNAFAFYSHIHWGSSIGWWENLLQRFILKSKTQRDIP
ncbi:cobyrinate a,c-diamide synthase [Nitrospina watsonii]|uniref:Cobyrinate a,c-diamide synthase n=1 Tax=Nitrospina watsonii TaxID=1323948 RepID=A0ABN8W7G2_9BACT|nr:cobyrinate a,c-diamide synthase [Nitrospina watsonii]CAI2719343.1 Cobyrinate a,c-diamide synthase [Nitrospina watsonii]